MAKDICVTPVNDEALATDARTMAVVREELDALKNEGKADPQRFVALYAEFQQAREREFAAHLCSIRTPFVGKVTTLTSDFNNAFNPDNPFAFNPFFDGYDENRPYELRDWKYATITDDGIVIKANTKKGLKALASTMSDLAPVMGEFGLFDLVSHVYELTGINKLHGEVINGRTQRHKTLSIGGESMWRWLPATLALCSDIPEDMRLSSMLYQLAAVDVDDECGVAI